MTIKPSSYEQLDISFNRILKEMKDGEDIDYGQYMLRMEEAFVSAGYREPITQGVIDIIIVRLDVIGDMILTSGFIREVRNNFPAANITLVVSKKGYPVVELCPYVNDIIVFPVEEMSNLSNKEMFIEISRFCREHFWKRKIIAAFSPRWYEDVMYPLYICWLSGTMERIGYGTYPYYSWLGNPPEQVKNFDNFLLTRNIITPRDIITTVDKNWYLLTANGFKIYSDLMELFYGANDFNRAQQLLADIKGKKICLGIGGSAPMKKYPVKKYLTALKKIVKENDTVIILGGKDEKEDAVFLEEKLKGNVLNLAGLISIRETMAVIAQSDIMISNDTCTIHMAAAAKVPVIGVYRIPKDKDGILPPILNELAMCPPYQTEHIIVRPNHSLPECADAYNYFAFCKVRDKAHCITTIRPSQIVKAYEKLISNKGAD